MKEHDTCHKVAFASSQINQRFHRLWRSRRVAMIPEAKGKNQNKKGRRKTERRVEKVGDMKKGKNKIANRSKGASASAVD